jgi:hypothetical protein
MKKSDTNQKNDWVKEKEHEYENEDECLHYIDSPSIILHK